MTSVECVQCGTRKEIASEAASGVSNGSSPPACDACGAPLEAKANDAPLNDIFSEFERTFHPTVNLAPQAETSAESEGEPVADSPPPASEQSAAEEQSSAPEEQSTAPEEQSTAPEEQSTAPEEQSTAPEEQSTAPVDVVTPEAESSEATQSAPSSVEDADAAAAGPAIESGVEAPAAVNVASDQAELPSVTALDAAPEAPSPELAPPTSRDDLALSSERAVESSGRMLAASPAPPWNSSNLRASIVDSEWSTPTAAEGPIGAESSDDFAPVASERPPAEPFEGPAQQPTSTVLPPEAPATEAIAAQAPAAEAIAPEATRSDEPIGAAAPAHAEETPAENPPASTAEIGSPPPSKGPPPPPAWAFANSDPEDSALARALRETAQLRRETGSREVYPAATFVEAAASGTMPIGTPAAVAEQAASASESGTARQPSIADSEHPSLADDDDANEGSPEPPSVGEPFVPSRVETTQRIEAVASPTRLTSEAPVVRSLTDTYAPAGEPLWGAPGSKRRSQVMSGAAALAVVAAFFLGRSSVSEPPREQAVALARPESPPTAPAAVPPPTVEQRAAETVAAPVPVTAPAPAGSSAASENGSGLVIVNNPKNHPAGSAPANGPAFDPQAAGRAIADAAARASSCRRLDQPTGRATITVTFGPSGKVSTANIYGLKFPSATVRNCMGGMLYQARVPAFTGAPVTVKKTLKI